jgi:hypothetical protein
MASFIWRVILFNFFCATCKGRDVRVAPGEPKNSVCKVDAPLEMPKVVNLLFFFQIV